MSEKEIFLAGFYSLSASDQKFSERLQERKTTT